MTPDAFNLLLAAVRQLGSVDALEHGDNTTAFPDARLDNSQMFTEFDGWLMLRFHSNNDLQTAFWFLILTYENSDEKCVLRRIAAVVEDAQATPKRAALRGGVEVVLPPTGIVGLMQAQLSNCTVCPQICVNPYWIIDVSANCR